MTEIATLLVDRGHAGHLEHSDDRRVEHRWGGGEEVKDLRSDRSQRIDPVGAPIALEGLRQSDRSRAQKGVADDGEMLGIEKLVDRRCA